MHNMICVSELLKIKTMKIETGYYWVTFYNHQKRYMMYFNGELFEGFKSEEMPNDEIESYKMAYYEDDF